MKITIITNGEKLEKGVYTAKPIPDKKYRMQEGEVLT